MKNITEEKINLNPDKRKKKAYISKKLATINLLELIQRVKKINNSNNKYSYPDKIKDLILFGSYLSDKKILGDIDIIYDTECRWVGVHERQEMIDFFWDKPKRNSFFQSLCNSDTATKTELRGNKKSFSFHDKNEFDTLSKIHGFRYVYLIKDFIVNEEWQKEAEIYFLQQPIMPIPIEILES
jgi:hypothetical protein